MVASGERDFHCKIKETLFIEDLKPAINVNISSEKLMLYQLLPFAFTTVKNFLNSLSHFQTPVVYYVET